MIKDAIISADKKYRYSLKRCWNPEKRQILFIGLNPSKADATADDNTITRLINFTKDHGYGGFEIVNLYALRATDYKELLKETDPFGPENWNPLTKWSGKLKTVIFMWGRHRFIDGEYTITSRVINMYPQALCFGHNQDGSPKHPLYLSSETKLIRFK
jgi:hypothetical protein